MAELIKVPHDLVYNRTPQHGQILYVTVHKDHVNACELKTPLPCHYISKYGAAEQGPLHKSLMNVKFSEPTTAQQIMDTLKRGIKYDQSRFSFLGCSTKQLRSKECYFIRGMDHEAYDRLSECFENLDKDIDERVRQIAGLFTEYEESVDIELSSSVDFDSNSATKQGTMSIKVAKEIQGKLGMKHRPSVVNVCLQGYQCVLVTDPNQSSESWICLPNSRKNLIEPDQAMQSTLGILVCSRPFSVGYLDEKMIWYLQDREVKGHDLEKFESDFIKLLNGLPENWDAAERCLEIHGHDSDLTKLYENLHSTHVPADLKNVLCELKKEMIGNETSDYRLLVPKSREVFGVRAAHNDIRKDECIFIPTLLGDDQKEFDRMRQVVVIRSPCYFRSDILVLKLNPRRVNTEKYSHLKDCIVFAANSSFPSPEEDERGEKYFVCWDDELIPKTPNETVPYFPSTAKVQSYVQSLPSKLAAALSPMHLLAAVASILYRCRGYSQVEQQHQEHSMSEYQVYFAKFLKTNCTDLLMMRAAEKIRDHDLKSHNEKTCKCLYLVKYLNRECDPEKYRKELLRCLQDLEKTDDNLETEPNDQQPSTSGQQQTTVNEDDSELWQNKFEKNSATLERLKLKRQQQLKSSTNGNK